MEREYVIVFLIVAWCIGLVGGVLIQGQADIGTCEICVTKLEECQDSLRKADISWFVMDPESPYRNWDGYEDGDIYCVAGKGEECFIKIEIHRKEPECIGCGCV